MKQKRALEKMLTIFGTIVVVGIALIFSIGWILFDRQVNSEKKLSNDNRIEILRGFLDHIDTMEPDEDGSITVKYGDITLYFCKETTTDRDGVNWKNFAVSTSKEKLPLTPHYKLNDSNHLVISYPDVGRGLINVSYYSRMEPVGRGWTSAGHFTRYYYGKNMFIFNPWKKNVSILEKAAYNFYMSQNQ